MKKNKYIYITLILIALIIFVPDIALAARLDYSSLCSNPGFKQAAKILGFVIMIIRWIVPLIIIVLGMVDFGKAAISNDEKALNKATASLIRRFVAGIVIFFIPTIIMAALNVVQVSKGIEKDTDTNFGACTKCLFDPVNSCNTGAAAGNAGSADSGE